MSISANSVFKEGKILRRGYTTGSCAAAATAAALEGFLNGAIPSSVMLELPGGECHEFSVVLPELSERAAMCGVVKDGGDDFDVTHGIIICSRVSMRTDDLVVISGGEGVGKITRDGFWGKAGDAAINPMPKKMITDEIRKRTGAGADVVISAPGGKEIALKTFNSQIGIVDGISILGTTGRVEPMSEEAFKKIIYLELDLIAERGETEVIFYPGNYGESRMGRFKPGTASVKISNFIGESFLYAVYKGFTKITLIGNIGKLCKLSIGIFNTHSRIADGRIESFVYHLVAMGANRNFLTQIEECTDSEAALSLCRGNGYGEVLHKMEKSCVDKLQRYIRKSGVVINVICYSMKDETGAEDLNG